MTAKKLITGLIVMVLVSSPLSVGAYDVRTDDLIITGTVCGGFDCVNGETFGDETLKLKENNVRIRFHDTAIGDALGESWNLEANSTANGGLDYFDFQVKSVEKDTPVFSDGTAWPAYDCSSNPPTMILDPDCPGAAGCQDRFNYALIPAGDPIIDVVPECDEQNPPVCVSKCVERLDHTVKSVFALGTAGTVNNGIAIGYQSALEDGVVSLGRSDLLRRITNVAAGINQTDLLTLEGLQIEDVVSLVQQIAAANKELDAIEKRIEKMEAGETINGLCFVGIASF